MKENDPEDIMNVVHLEDYVIFRKHLCISFELLSMNLFEFLKINDFNVSSNLSRANMFMNIGIWSEFDSQIRNSAPLRAQVPQDVPNHPLWFKTWKHYAQGK